MQFILLMVSNIIWLHAMQKKKYKVAEYTLIEGYEGIQRLMSLFHSAQFKKEIRKEAIEMGNQYLCLLIWCYMKEGNLERAQIYERKLASMPFKYNSSKLQGMLKYMLSEDGDESNRLKDFFDVISDSSEKDIYVLCASLIYENARSERSTVQFVKKCIQEIKEEGTSTGPYYPHQVIYDTILSFLFY